MSSPYLPGDPYQQRPPHGPSDPWAPPATTSRGAGKGLAITALVISVLSLLGVIGLALVQAGSFLSSGFMGDMASGEYELMGTAAQVQEGEPYPGDRLQLEVERVLEIDWSTYEDVRCDDTSAVRAGVKTSCDGIVDDMDTEMTVEFEDGEGHFVLVQTW